MATEISHIMNDKKTATVFKDHFPDAALQDAGLQDIIEFLPNVPFQQIWSQLLAERS